MFTKLSNSSFQRENNNFFIDNTSFKLKNALQQSRFRNYLINNFNNFLLFLTFSLISSFFFIFNIDLFSRRQTSLKSTSLISNSIFRRQTNVKKIIYYKFIDFRQLSFNMFNSLNLII